MPGHARQIAGGENPPVPAPDTDETLARLAALPAAAPLLERLGDVPGVYLVGGAVRDLLLGGAPVDMDLVVDGELDPVTARLGTPARAHSRFETGTLVLDGFTYDLARARRERYAHPGALPTVEPAPIEVDLLRRDFGVNALALGLGGDTRGRLLAAPGGLEDLRARRLRVLHDASFIDDPTRLVRLARYASRLGFQIEAHTRDLVRSAVAGRATDTVSGSRLGAELRLLAAEPDPVAGLRALAGLEIDELLAPGFGIRTDAAAEAARRALALLPADGDPGAVALAVASLGLEPEDRVELLERLAFGAGQRDVILAAAGRAPALAEALAGVAAPSRIAAAVGRAPVELVALAGALGAEPQARRWLDELRHVRLEIDGQDLLDSGIQRGPEIGRALARALAAKLDGRAAGRDAELAEALRAPQGTG
jgi:tRNA nucleotidyltransferase (CCA-adding enzyme)